MKNKKNNIQKKLINALFIIFTLCFISNNIICYASEFTLGTTYNIDKITENTQIKQFSENEETEAIKTYVGDEAKFIKVDIDKLPVNEINTDSGMSSIISKIFGVVQYVCIAAALIIILVTGVKFAYAAPDEKADIKKQAISLVIGAAIVFSIASIVRIIANVTRNAIQ